VLWRRTFDRVLLLVPGSDRCLSLSGTGMDLWESLLEARSMHEIAEALANEYCTSRARVERDIAPALDALVAADAMHVIVA
jgi:Coenzyme PQQ synthesis protein D (PqqD)